MVTLSLKHIRGARSHVATYTTGLTTRLKMLTLRVGFRQPSLHHQAQGSDILLAQQLYKRFDNTITLNVVN